MYVHTKSLIDRDSNQINFLIGSVLLVFLIDFGWAPRYRDDRTKQHVPSREDDNLCGTPRQAGIVSAHLGIEQIAEMPRHHQDTRRCMLTAPACPDKGSKREAHTKGLVNDVRSC